jgi:hypothetical protein
MFARAEMVCYDFGVTCMLEKEEVKDARITRGGAQDV